ncbi:glycosyltransferase [Enterococcus gallinarum]|uniref:glycosyltransferase n=1 Tax=Enterococcus gallinarum TaxID=1353 RepID=UPI00214CF1FB|nr:glycosyltransferase [Enterococcus gallinarum]MCR1928782.1 glycosyltransferase [Enterococcus gallinarum]
MLTHTFIICAYKESPFLEKCIQSCINQISVKKQVSQIGLYTSTPNEYIINLAEKYSIPLYTKEGGSIGRDWNNALSFVQTKYATIVHQDDIYLKNYGEEILKTFELNKTATIVFTDYEEIDGDGKVRKRSVNLKIKTFGLKMMDLIQIKWYQRRIYAFGNFICCPAVSYNLDLLKTFKFNENMRMAVDWDAWERIMKFEGKICFIPLKEMQHRIHAGSETTATTVDKTRELEEFEMYQRYWGKGIANILMKFYVHNQKSNQL